MRISDSSQTYVLNISGLHDKLIYDIFLTTKNDWPEWNKLLEDGKVAAVEAKTLKIRSKNYLLNNI